MKKRITLLILLAAMAGAGRIDGAVTADAPQPTSPTTLRLIGTIESYDPSTRSLSVATSNGTVLVQVTSTARIRRGWHDLAPSELEKLGGYRVAVRYSEAGGSKAVESVHVLERSERTRR